MLIEVRLAGKDDIEKLHDIVEEMDKCEIGLRDERFKEALGSRLSSYLVAICEDRAIGFLNLWHIPDIVDGGFIGVILDCYVLGEYRSRGVGKMLMEAAMDLGSKCGINKYFSWVDPGNKSAISLLKKFGFGSENLMLEKKE
ncbi:MAG: GNAT family N-acetyltransferase [Candidatus Zixiibacteriota bacterium]|nr:MAG: GNAT family N-acetyltransferase [candidate division Zixibacteria bacterium]